MGGRGFNLVIHADTVEDITEEAFDTEVAGAGRLTVFEPDFIAAGVAAARAIAETIKRGPFIVQVHGVDNSQKAGEVTDIGVRVESSFTLTGDELPEPSIAADDPLLKADETSSEWREGDEVEVPDEKEENLTGDELAARGLDKPSAEGSDAESVGGEDRGSTDVVGSQETPGQ